MNNWLFIHLCLKVWNVSANEELNPLRFFKAYKRRREEIFGKAEMLPMFLHENGSIYSKVELNADLGKILAMFPELENPRDSYTGHSFRSGISTVLSLLGFPEEDIKSWGRWKSDAYLRYIKDQSQRRYISSKLKKTFNSILSYA